ncbi:MAG TPA: hypothetical protein DDX39_08575 [Bacteroidales bacterium]|nr:MAG: hypothetical protein A2W98_04590 [Bacteroidetes bacterium GWF2_33_38]HBF88682.1 hypothetical protein [Bacteroidales bacterium]
MNIPVNSNLADELNLFEHYKSFADSAIDWEMIQDVKGKYIYISPSFFNITGYEVLNLTENPSLIEKIMHPDYIEYYKNEHCESFRNSEKSHNLEFKIISKNGTEKWIEHYCKPLFNEKGIRLGRKINNRDITEKKIIHNIYSEEKRKFDTLTKNIAGFAYRCKNDENWTMEFISSGCFEVTGYHSEDFINNHKIPFNDIIHPSHQHKLWEEWQTVLAKNATFKGEYQIICADGKVRWVWEQGCGIYDTKGKLLALEGFIMDITERKENETKIKNSEEQYRVLASLTMDSASVACFYPDGRIEREWLSDKLFKEYGIPPSDIDTFEKWAKFVHPEDLHIFIDASKIVMRGESASRDFRVITPAKGIRWINNSIISNIIKEKGCLKIYSAVSDITDIKEAELKLIKTNQDLEFSKEELIQADKKLRNQMADLKRINNELQISEKRFRELTNTIGSAVFIFQNEKFCYVNKEFTNISGYSEEEAFNLNFWDFVHPDYIDIIKQRGFSRIMGESISPRYEFKIIRKDGQERWIDYTGGLIEFKNSPAGLGTAFDVTTKKLAEEKLRKLSRAVEQSPVSIVITNPKGAIEYVNPKFEEITGYKLSEILNLNPNVLKSGYTSKAVYEEMWKILLEGKEWRGEFYNKKKDGTLYWERVFISPIFNKESNITHFVAIKEDITELKEVMSELVLAKEKAIESEKLKSAFLANMSHEIRTPMNAIMGFSELLLSDDLSKEQQKDFSEIIWKRSNDLLHLIDDILDISKIESGVLKITETDGRIDELFAEIYQFFNSKYLILDKKNIVLRFINKIENNKLLIHTDFYRLKQIIFNLVDNAIKFTEDGYVVCSCEIINNDLLFSVRDTGIGMNSGMSEKVFDRFWQADAIKKTNYGGTGLGLSISKGLVEIMGGKIWVTSELNQGSQFYFTIPYKSAVQEINKNNPKTSYDLSSKTFLIVEDDNANKKFLQILLENHNAKVFTADSGYNALELAQKVNGIDIVMMDIRLPDISGYEVTKQIRESFPDIKIIAQTAYANQEDRIKCLAEGFDNYISKPINQSALFKILMDYV